MNATTIDTDIRAPRVTGVYTAPERAERDDHGELKYETEPDASLLPTERKDLLWRWNDCEAELGVKCTFGAQLDAALSQRISDEALKDARAVMAMLTRLRKGWRPRASRRARRRQSDVNKAFLAHVGIELRPALGSADGNAQRAPVLDVSDLSDQRIYMHAPLRPVPSDPYENDGIFWLVRRLRAVDRRLVAIGRSHARILESYFGPASSGEDRLPMRKRFGDLVEIVVAIMASQRSPTDKPARALVREKLHDDSFVRVMKHGASGYLRAAANAFAGTRFECVRCGVLTPTKACAACAGS